MRYAEMIMENWYLLVAAVVVAALAAAAAAKKRSHTTQADTVEMTRAVRKSSPAMEATWSAR